MHLIWRASGIKRHSKPVPDFLFPIPQITNDTCYQHVTHIKQINHCRRTSSGTYTRHSQTLHRKNQTIQALDANYSAGFSVHYPTNGLLIYRYTLCQLHKTSCNYNLDNNFMNYIWLIKFYPFIHVIILLLQSNRVLGATDDNSVLLLVEK